MSNTCPSKDFTFKPIFFDLIFFLNVGTPSGVHLFDHLLWSGLYFNHQLHITHHTRRSVVPADLCTFRLRFARLAPAFHSSHICRRHFHSTSTSNIQETLMNMEKDAENVLKYMASNGLVANAAKT